MKSVNISKEEMPSKLTDLISALSVFAKYNDPIYPTHCENDVLYVVGFHKDSISPDDLRELDRLGFFWDEEDEYFKSFRFGSA